MCICGSLDSWKRCQHGPRVQAKAIEYIAERIEVLEAIQYEDDNYNIILKPIFASSQSGYIGEVKANMLVGGR